MKSISRTNYILNVVNKSGKAFVTDLANDLDVSVETIRRDLKVLDEKGELIRVHGGAIGKNYKDEGTSFNNRANRNVNDKMDLVDRSIHSDACGNKSGYGWCGIIAFGGSHRYS